MPRQLALAQREYLKGASRLAVEISTSYAGASRIRFEGLWFTTLSALRALPCRYPLMLHLELVAFKTDLLSDSDKQKAPRPKARCFFKPEVEALSQSRAGWLVPRRCQQSRLQPELEVQPG